jgi:hypothetical protein
MNNPTPEGVQSPSGHVLQNVLSSVQARNADINSLPPNPFQPAMLKTYMTPYARTSVSNKFLICLSEQKRSEWLDGSVNACRIGHGISDTLARNWMRIHRFSNG